eukprot:scaffold80548_cov63-Phaeocystis_antarctica.AAC.2
MIAAATVRRGCNRLAGPRALQRLCLAILTVALPRPRLATLTMAPPHLRRVGEEVGHLGLVCSASALRRSDPRQRGEAGGLCEGRLLQHLVDLPPLLLMLLT